MAETNGRPWWQTVLIAAAALVIVVVPLSGVIQQVWENAAQIRELEGRVIRLRDNLELVDEIDARIAEVEQEVGRIEAARADILEAICAATARDGGAFDRCVRVADSDGGAAG